MDNKIIFKLLNSEGLRFPMILPSIILPKFSSQFIDLLCSRSVILVLCILCLSWFSPDAQASSGFEHYEVILSRAPFGKEPPPSETAQPAAPVGEFAKQYRLCMLYEDAHGQLKAGLVSKTNNKNFFLQVGESESGLSLVEVRLEENVAVVRKGAELAQLTLEGVGTPVITATAASGVSPVEGNRVVAKAGSGQIGVKKGYSFLQPVLPEARPQQTTSTRKLKRYPPGFNPVSGGNSATTDKTQTSDDSAADENFAAFSSPLDTQPKGELIHKRIVVTSSKAMPSKFAFIPR
jgi:hypothetical protein